MNSPKDLRFEIELSLLMNIEFYLNLVVFLRYLLFIISFHCSLNLGYLESIADYHNNITFIRLFKKLNLKGFSIRDLQLHLLF